MISKNDTKRIQRLHQKKFRNKEGLFIAETPKVVDEFIRAGFVLNRWYASERYDHTHRNLPEPEWVSDDELKKVSRLETPNAVLAIFEIPQPMPSSSPSVLSLALDGVRDPGNMGTIIRLADWFAIDDVYCSLDCVDIWNPKVVQSTMGSLARVMPVTVDLAAHVDDFKSKGGAIYVADLGGPSHYETRPQQPTLLIMGNEANGPSEALVSRADGILTIPNFRKEGAESLNVSVATAILISELKRP